MQEKLQMQMEIKLKNVCLPLSVCVCVWQADSQHVGKQFGDMIER